MGTFISLKEASRILGVAVSTAARLVHAGKLDAIRDALQSRLLISRSSVEIFMRQRFKKEGGKRNGKR